MNENKQIATGMSLGIVAGATIGLITNNLGLWLPLGLVFGVAIGAGLKAKNSKK